MLGFACICNSLLENGSFRATTIKAMSKLSKDEQLKKLRSIAVDNLFNTAKIIRWCSENQIFLYRMSSELIPLATYYNDWFWWEDEDIKKQCDNIKSSSEECKVRISMHPDQFCVLNSEKDSVVIASVEILKHHNRLSNLTGNKLLVLHIGSTAGGKKKAIERFKSNFNLLEKDIKEKLVLENDDKSFTAMEVLTLCEDIGIPMVLDIHHHNCCNQGEDIHELRSRIISTWHDRKPKMHLSSGKSHPLDRSHADLIALQDYFQAIEFAQTDFDIMLECKKKDLALIELRNKLKAAAELS